MAQKDSSQGKLEVKASISSETPLPPAQGANFFHFTIVAGEVQLIVGNLNLIAIHEGRNSEGTLAIAPDLTARYTLSPLGFNNLRSQMAQLESQLAEQAQGGKRQ